MLTCKLYSCCDLLEKLRSDLKLLQEQVTSYRFFNFVITGYHIIDWIKNGDRIQESTRSAATEMRKNEYISICRDLTNASKHFKLNYKNRKVDSAKSVQGCFGTGRLGKGVFGIGEESITIKCSDGHEYNALELAKAILQTWETFFTTNNIQQSTPTAAGQ